MSLASLSVSLVSHILHINRNTGLLFVQPSSHVFSKTAPTILFKLIYVLDKHKTWIRFFVYVINLGHFCTMPHWLFLYMGPSHLHNVFLRCPEMLMYFLNRQMWQHGCANFFKMNVCHTSRSDAHDSSFWFWENCVLRS